MKYLVLIDEVLNFVINGIIKTWQGIKFCLFIVGAFYAYQTLNNFYADWYYKTHENRYTAQECMQVANDKTLADLDAAKGNQK